MEKGYGYHRIWKMLHGNGVEISRSTARRYYYKIFPEWVGRRGACLDRTTRIRIFSEIKRLRMIGYSYGRIIEAIEEMYGVRLSKSFVSRWLRGIRSPFSGRRIPSIDFLKKTPDCGYVIGVVAGDGWAIRSREGDMWIGSKAKDREFIEEFAESLERFSEGRRRGRYRYGRGYSE